MKPSFALNLTHGGIGLLHRTGSGWLSVGEVPLDAPDLAQALATLRRTALGLVPQGIISKVVIPATQVLYLSIEASGPDAARRRAQIAKALEGRTPYPVADLVFDWSGTGKTVRVAVVARDTLSEAAAFAELHRFNPVSFVTIPGPGDFAGEPFFGLTRSAAQYLPEGARLDRDQDPIRILGLAAPRPQSQEAEVAFASEAVPETEAEVAAPASGSGAEARQAEGPETAAASAEPAEAGALVAMVPEAAAVPEIAAALPTPEAATVPAGQGLARAAGLLPDAAASDTPGGAGPEQAQPAVTQLANDAATTEPVAAEPAGPEPKPGRKGRGKSAAKARPAVASAGRARKPGSGKKREAAQTAANAEGTGQLPTLVLQETQTAAASDVDAAASAAAEPLAEVAASATADLRAADPTEPQPLAADAGTPAETGSLPADASTDTESAASPEPEPEIASEAGAEAVAAASAAPDPLMPAPDEAASQAVAASAMIEPFTATRNDVRETPTMPKGLSARRDAPAAQAGAISFPRALALARADTPQGAGQRPATNGTGLLGRRAAGEKVPDPRLAKAAGTAPRGAALAVAGAASLRPKVEIKPLFQTEAPQLGAARRLNFGATGADIVPPPAASTPTRSPGSAARLQALAGRAAASGSTAGLTLARKLAGKTAATEPDLAVADAPPQAAAPTETPPRAPARTSVFGGPIAAAARGRPKHLGLALTAALVVFMAIVVLWSVFLGTPVPDVPSAAPEAPVTTLAAPPATSLAASGAPQLPDAEPVTGISPPLVESVALAPAAVAATAEAPFAVAIRPPATEAVAIDPVPADAPTPDVAAAPDVVEIATAAPPAAADPPAPAAEPVAEPTNLATAEPLPPLPTTPGAPAEPEAAVPPSIASDAQLLATVDPGAPEVSALTADSGVTAALPALAPLPAFSSAQLAAMAREASAAAAQAPLPTTPAAPAPVSAPPLPIVSLPPNDVVDTVAPPSLAPAPVAATDLAATVPPAAGEVPGAGVPTVEGTAMPGGFTLYAGHPEAAPGPRPTAIEAAARVARAAADAAIAAEAAALAAARPQPRPLGLNPATAPATAPAGTPEAPQTAPATPNPAALPAAPQTAPAAPAAQDRGLTDAERAEIAALAARKPALRPQAISAAAAAASAARVAEAERVAAGLATATPQAVAAAPRPIVRPRSISAAATRALDQALAEAMAAQPAPVANGQHIETGEPEAPAVVSTGATPTSVAQQATQTGAINLSELTLVGLFGAAGARRALLRLPSGRFQTVEVGDRVDGGQVVAISETQMSYVKGSNTITLKLLQSN
ncbi:MAG: hypothetical protein Q8Q63_01355 [Phaeovulum sp.]|uniref:hypothetical protein n=1 Tax=Phaeovulum sp. TaxID=2934796 RepID=UPI002733F3C0|nr:hypothetical protein [Phaeovulum sp.]MDP3860215.1 hypothetical protein [Phaeovulum sp.]